MLEVSPQCEKEEKTVGFCFQSELNSQIDWNALFNKEDDWLGQVAGDDDMKFGVTEEELFGTLKIECR